MAEKLCLQWNDFQGNARKAFGHLRGATDFADVTLACEDGKQIEAHKVILAASSPFFQRILKGNKHSHPLIFMRGVKCDDLTSILDFLYFGESKVYQENLDNFLAIAEELQLKGLEGSKDRYRSNEEEQLKLKEKHKANHRAAISRKPQIKNKTTHDSDKTGMKTSVFSADLQELHETVKAMMQPSENMIQMGKKQTRAKICRVCGKEGQAADIIRHIEVYHLEGISIPCSFCDKILGSRNALRLHVSKDHK